MGFRSARPPARSGVDEQGSVRTLAVDLSLSRDTAVDTLFRDHYAALLRTAYVVLGTREAAEDAVQEAFVSLYRNWDGLRNSHSAEHYLRSAVLNRCRSGIRELVRTRTLAALPTAPPAAESGEDVTLGREQVSDLAAAMRRLPRRQREVVACRYLLELTVAETAGTLGIADGAVKRHAHRALKTLHQNLGVAR